MPTPTVTTPGLARYRAKNLERLAALGITVDSIPAPVRERPDPERRYMAVGWAWAALMSAAEQPTKANLQAAVREALAVLSADELLAAGGES